MTEYAAVPAVPAAVAVADRKTNTLAIVSLVSAFLVGLVGIICGAIALRQITRRNEGGRGLAIAGIIVGSLNVVCWIGVALIMVALITTGTALLEQCAELGPGVHYVDGVRIPCR